jgi:hypothetical protein
MTQVEEMWDHQDTLFRIIDVDNDWDHPHGSDWTFADVTYHLAYCNRDLVARGMELGPELPAEEQITYSGIAGINEFNEQKFGERPEGQSPAESLAEVRASWDYIRRVTWAMTDADLERPFWMPLSGQWIDARGALMWCLTHDWTEFMQLRLHMGRSEPVPSPEITNQYLGFMLGVVFPFLLNKEAAAGRTFTAVMAFTDPGVSDFTIRVADGAAAVTPGSAEDADLVITQSVETFESTFRGIKDPAEAMQDGSTQVSDMAGLAVFGELFPMDF